MKERYIIEIKLKRDEIDSFEIFPFCLNGIKSIKTIKLNPAVTFFIGENGSGKSTLLEAIAMACGFNPEGGTKNFKFGTRESHSNLWKYIRLSRSYKRPKDGFFFRAESFFNVATEIERLDSEFSFGPPVINSYGRVSLHEQSHGESFWSLVMTRFGGKGIYILDEPEAALSPSGQMALITRIHDLVLNDSQFIIATHSPILMSYPNATLYQLGEGGITQVHYTETEHFLLTRKFLNDHERMLRVLMDEYQR